MAVIFGQSVSPISHSNSERRLDHERQNPIDSPIFGRPLAVSATGSIQRFDRRAAGLCQGRGPGPSQDVAEGAGKIAVKTGPHAAAIVL